jgi:FkbM family methyltransferase
MKNKITSRHEHGAGGAYLLSPFIKKINKNEIKVIFEAGSRDLLDAINLRNYYPNSVVYAFECNPEGVDICKHNLQNEHNIIFNELALCSSNGVKQFYSFDSDKTLEHNHGVSSFYEHKKTESVPQNKIDVKCITIDSFCKENNISQVDMFCFDMQGGEYDALLGASDILKTVKYVILENDGWAYSGTPSFEKIEKLLNYYGLEITVTIDYGQQPPCQQDILFSREKKITDFIDGNKFKQLADVYIDEEKRYVTAEELTEAELIFIKGDLVDSFKQKVLPHIKNDFKLITHNADTPNPSPHEDLLNDKRLIHWYGMNANLTHDKFTPIPIGIANDRWPHGNKELLYSIKQNNNKKDKLVYCNFDFSTNPYRHQVYEQIKDEAFIDFDFTKRTQEDYWATLSQYKFVISPRGNSIDCHRVWEAIYLGVVPIVEKHLAMELFHDFPILMIDNWSDLDSFNLNQDLYSSLIRDFDINKLNAKNFLK